MPPLWTIELDDLGLSVRPRNALIMYNIRMAWHAAALCQRCLACTRNCGEKSLRDIRQQPKVETLGL